MQMMIIMLMNFLIMIIMILVGIAFLTLLERKILSYIHNRKGPNKVGFSGIFQPFSDAMKLLTKEYFFINVNKFVFMISPMIMLLFSMMLWLIYPWILNMFNFSVMFFILILGMSIYPIIFIGWFSNNNYSMLGALRPTIQMISFEISLFIMLFIFMLMIESYSFMKMKNFQLNYNFFMMFYPLYLMFLTSMFIEMNRTPFDLIEGESELVSGFNVEYYSSMFTLIFLAEYSGIMFTSMIMTLIFFLMKFWSMMFIMFFLFHMLMVLWLRGVLPRIRYDKLMYLCWIDFLIISLIYLILIYLAKEFIMIMMN